MPPLQSIIDQLDGQLQALRTLAESDTPVQTLEQAIFCLAAGTPNAMWIKDLRFRMIWHNAAFSRIFGKNLAEYQGRTDVEVWGEEVGRVSLESDRAALANMGPSLSIEHVPMPDGSSKDWAVKKTPIFMPGCDGDPDAEPVLLMGEAADLEQWWQLVNFRTATP